MKKSLLAFFTALLLLSIFFQPSCRNLQQVEQNADVLFNKSSLSHSLDGYDVYVHDANGIVKLENPRVSGDTLYGNKGVAADEKEVVPSQKSLDVYVDDPTPTTYTSVKDKIILTKKQIRRVLSPNNLRPKELSKNSGDGDGVGIAIGLILLLVILGILIIWLIIYLIIQSTNQAAQSSSNGGSSSGCYIATMVYGSYDAPEVMTLRKFRDETLSRSAGGRAFIRWYYGWSPGFVKKYNHLTWLHKIIRVVLNGLVKLLSK